MTEAAHQMAANPLQGVRKPGSVGLAAGPEIAIMDEKGRLLGAARPARSSSAAKTSPRLREQPEGQRRGLRRRLVPHRRSGRHRRGRLSHAHRAAEGDHQSRRREDLAARGRRSADGSPRGPAGGDLRRSARQARRGGRGGGRVARGHERRPNRSCALSSPARLAAFKTPRKIVFLAEIPKGATGKLQRIGLAEKLGLA